MNGREPYGSEPLAPGPVAALGEARPGSSGLVGWALDAGRFGLVLLDGSGRVAHANQAACELVGREHADLIARPMTDLVHPDDRGWAEAELALLLAGAVDRIRHEARLIVADDDHRWTELNIRFVADAPDRSIRAVVLLEDAGDRPLRERELRRLADTDPLTDLPNRRRFAAELDRHLAWTARYGARGALLLLDVDGLKSINDTRGHLAGDQAILTIARLLREHTRSSDTIARIGGDEFAVLLPAASGEDAIAATTTLREGLRTARPERLPAPPTVSVGIAIVTGATHATSLLHLADTAMYEAKRSGGDGYGIRRTGHHARRPGAHAQSPSLHLVSSDRLPDPERSISLHTLLQAVGQLGGAGPRLTAWELYTSERVITPVWSAAIRDGLLERARYDRDDQSWQYQLTPAGERQRRALEREAQALE